jgi:hypothetical protein
VDVGARGNSRNGITLRAWRGNSNIAESILAQKRVEELPVPAW